MLASTSSAIVSRHRAPRCSSFRILEPVEMKDVQHLGRAMHSSIAWRVFDHHCHRPAPARVFTGRDGGERSETDRTLLHCSQHRRE